MTPEDAQQIKMPLPDFVEAIVRRALDEHMEKCPSFRSMEALERRIRKVEQNQAKLSGIVVGAAAVAGAIGGFLGSWLG